MDSLKGGIWGKNRLKTGFTKKTKKTKKNHQNKTPVGQKIFRKSTKLSTCIDISEGGPENVTW